MHNQEMISLDQKDSLQKNEMYGYLHDSILPLNYVLDDITVINLEAENIKKLCNGQVIAHNFRYDNPKEVFVKHQGVIIALGEASEGLIKPITILKEN